MKCLFPLRPTFAMSMTKSGDSWDMGYGYASLFVTGAAVSYKAISVGCEYRFGSTKMNVISMDTDDAKFDNIEDMSGIGGIGDVLGEMFSTTEKTKYKLKDPAPLYLVPILTDACKKQASVAILTGIASACVRSTVVGGQSFSPSSRRV